MITSITERIAALPHRLRAACEHIFYVERIAGYTVPPPTMEAWIARQFGAIADVREQTIVKIVNRLTLEGAIFNPLRARRPLELGGDDVVLEARIAEKLAAHDIFREPLRDTTADLFGRIRGRFCLSASNVAKYDGWHGLVIFDEPHPLRFDRTQLDDYIDVALRWISAAHTHDEQAIYPIITWNCLPKSGATLMHGHMQLALARGMHYTRIEGWRRAAAAYGGAGYFDDLFAIHQALGLAIPHRSGLRIFAHLTPLRNREIVLLADSPLAPPAAQVGPERHALADAIYDVLRGLIDRQGVRAFNMLIALPPIDFVQEWRGLPAIVRLADRGDPLAASNDWGAIELFATGCVIHDPFEVAAAIRTED